MNNINTSSKQTAILKTAHDLFWKHGIKRVTIEEVCRESGVSKMTFYRSYTNKIELAKAVISNLFNESISKFRDLMAQDISFEEKVKQQILMKFEGTKEISQELIKDIYGGQIPELKEYWEKKSADVLHEVLNYYREAQNQGFIRKDVNIEFIEFYSSKLFELAYDERASSLFNNPQEMIMQLQNLFFYGILPHEEKK